MLQKAFLCISNYWLKRGKMQHFSIKKEKVNKNKQFTKSCIETALFDLLKSRDLEDISISEIVKRAGVSRMGFYRNYVSKEDIIEQYVLNIFLDTIREIESKRSLDFNIEHMLTTTLIHFQKHAYYIKLLLDRKLDLLLHTCYEKSFYYLYNQERPSHIREYSTRMFIGEIFNLEIAWVRNGMVETPQQMAKIYFRILKLRCNASN